MRFAILGPLEVHRGDDRPHISSHLQQLLLAVLIARGGPVPADTLMDTLWSGNPPGDARKALGWHMHALRKALGGRDHIVHRGGGYVLEHRPDDVDAVRFETLLREGSATLDSQPEAAAETLAAALALWRGRAYADLADTPMLRDEANRLEELRLSALEQHATAQLELGRHGELTAELARLVAEHPYRERFREQLMLALYRGGRQADALETFRQGQELAADNLGLDPGPVLRELQQRILNSDPGLEPRPREAVTRRPDTVVPQQLPADVSAFTGRRVETEQLLAAAQTTETIMVTALDGMAGIGKTTLAVHLAHRLAPRFPDGQLFIDLHGYSGEVAPVSPAEALDRMLRALGVAAQQIPEHLDDRAALFRSVLSGRRVLLLLDNAAGAQQIRPLLPGTPGNLTLITSRRRFGELDDPVLVSLGLLTAKQSTQLFVRAGGLPEPDAAQLDVISRIVEHCGRLTLAIRIAAHQLRRRSSWTLAELDARLSRESDRLETLSVRDRSVPAAFHVSYRDLDPEQQRTFRLLSVFPQPHFDAQAAAALADVPLPAARRQLDDMVDAHLLDTPGPGLYAFHDLMRQFAAATSRHTETDTGREAASFRLLDVYRNTAFAESARITTRLRAEPAPAATVRPPEPPTGDVDFPADQPSLEAAVAKAIGLGVDAHLWQLGDLTRELAAERDGPVLRALLDQATTALAQAAETQPRAIALNNLAAVQLLHREYPRAVENFERSLRAREEIGDVRGQAAVLNSLGVTHNQLGNLDAAATCFDRAVSSAFQAGADQTEAHAITNYVVLADYLDMHEQALPLLNRARDIFSRNAHPRQQSRLSFCFGVVYGGMSQPERALKHLHRAREFAERSSEHFELSHILTAIAVNQRRLGNHADAVVNHRKAIRAGALAEDQGLKARNLIEFGRTRLALGEYDTALADFRRGAKLAVEATYRYEQARAEHGLADCHQALGDPMTSQKHLRECVRIYTDMGAPQARELRRRLTASDN